MIADQPFVSYKRDNKNGEEKKHTAAEMNALAERWRKSRNGESLAGKKVSLADYLSRKVEPGMKL